MSDLTNIWTKSNCLSQTQLLQYLQQKLEREEVYLVESHINDCPMCNDALEGLMHSDLEKGKEHFVEMKSDFEKKLGEIKPIEKPKTGSASSQTKSAKSPSSPTTLKSSKGSKFRWAYAASVLLIVGLGYSVFSFIKDYTKKSNLAHTKENPKFTSAETPYTPVNDSSGELIRIEASPEDIGQLSTRPTEDKKSENKVSPPPAITATKAVKPSINIREQSTSQDELSDRLTEKDKIEEKPATKSVDVPSYSSESMQNYSKEEAESKKEGKKQISSQKTPGYGMSKNNAAPQTQNNAANQLNYSSNSNLQKESTDYLTSTNVGEKGKYDKVKEEVSNYQEALSQYNKGRYKKSIKQLEKLLPSSKGEQREDIIYYLAMSHLKQENLEEANTYFNQLRNTAKYSQIVAPYLSEIKQVAPAKKK